MLPGFIDKLEESRREKTKRIKYGVNQLRKACVTVVGKVDANSRMDLEKRRDKKYVESGLGEPVQRPRWERGLEPEDGRVEGANKIDT